MTKLIVGKEYYFAKDSPKGHILATYSHEVLDELFMIMDSMIIIKITFIGFVLDYIQFTSEISETIHQISKRYAEFYLRDLPINLNLKLI